MYSRGAGIAYGFHGCNKQVAEDVINNRIKLKSSTNDFDWLGHGMYFWENSPERALEFAQNLKTHPERSKNPIKECAVIGAVIHLGNCLDLTNFQSLQSLKAGFSILKESMEMAGKPLPRNRAAGVHGDLFLRRLDCAVIETLHDFRKQKGLSPFDSVKGAFWEGGELYPNAGFREKDHIQLCVINPNCIRGFFWPREFDPGNPVV